MNTLLQFIGILSLLFIYIKIIDTDPIEIVNGLDSRLTNFWNCNIILRSWDFENTWLEPMNVPVLVESHIGDEDENATVLLDNYNSSFGSMIKYRGFPCSLDIFILSRDEVPENYTEYFVNQEKEGYDHADPAFLIIILHHREFANIRKTKMTWLDDPKVLLHLMIFVWTVRRSNISISKQSNNPLVTYHLDQKRYYLCQYCRSKVDDLVKHRVYEFILNKTITQNRQDQMDAYVREMRKNVAWNMDDRVNCHCPIEAPRYNGIIPFKMLKLKLKGGQTEFSKFITNLILPNHTVANITMTINTTDYEFFDLPNFCFRGAMDIHHDEEHGFLAIPVGQVGYNFVTCHSEYSEGHWETILIFLQPFQAIGWLLIGSSITLCTLCLVLKKRLQLFPHKVHPIILALMFYSLEVPASGINRLLRKDWTLKMLFVSWLFCTFVLTNWYKGVNTALDSKPWKPTEWKDFNELKNFKFYIHEREVNLPANCPKPKHDDGDDDGHDHSHSHEFETSSFEQHLNKIWSVWNNYTYRYYRDIFVNDNVVKTPSEEIVSSISACSRSAYISYTTDTDDFFILQNRTSEVPGKLFYKGRENFIPQTINWVFKDIPEAQPQFRLAQLLSAGIYDFWKYWLHDRGVETGFRVLLERNENTVHPVSLKSNVHHIFYILIFFWIVSIVVLGIECIFFACQQVFELNQQQQAGTQIIKVQQTVPVTRVHLNKDFNVDRFDVPNFDVSTATFLINGKVVNGMDALS